MKRYTRGWQPSRCPECADAGIGPEFCGWSEKVANGEVGECGWGKRPENELYPNKPRCHTCRETGHKANRCTNIQRIKERLERDPTYYQQ